MFVVDCCKKSALKGVAVKNTHLSEDYHSCSRFFGRLICEFAVLKRKELVSLTNKVGNQPNQVVVFVLVDITLWTGAAIHKNVFLTRVAMKIAIEKHGVVSGTLFG